MTLVVVVVWPGQDKEFTELDRKWHTKKNSRFWNLNRKESADTGDQSDLVPNEGRTFGALTTVRELGDTDERVIGNFGRRCSEKVWPTVYWKQTLNII